MTKVRSDNTAWAWAERMSQMAARGLAPRRTPEASRLARHSVTAYSATAAATVDRLGGALGRQPLLGVVHTGAELVEGEPAPLVGDEPGLGVGVGIADGGGQGEAVELALDQRVRARVGRWGSGWR